MRLYCIYDEVTDQYLTATGDWYCGCNDDGITTTEPAPFVSKKDANDKIESLTKEFLQNDPQCEINFSVISYTIITCYRFR